MKVTYTLLLCLISLAGYCQDMFTYKSGKVSSISIVEPKFDRFSFEEKEEAPCRMLDEAYYQRVIYGIVKASVPQDVLDSLYMINNAQSTISVFLDPNGNIKYSIFVLLNDDRKFLADSMLYTIYQNLKKKQLDLSKIEFDLNQGGFSKKNDNPENLYYCRISVPFIPDELAGSRRKISKPVSRNAPAGTMLTKGQPFPEMVLNTVDDEIIDPSALKGKVTVYFFYDPQHPSCEAAMLGMRNLNKKFEKDDVTFISVTFAQKDDIWKFRAIHRMPFKAVSLPRDEMNRLTRIYPSAVVVDAEGIVALVWRAGSTIVRRTVRNFGPYNNPTSGTPSTHSSYSSTQVYDTKDPKHMDKLIMEQIAPVVKQEVKRAKKMKKNQEKGK